MIRGSDKQRQDVEKIDKWYRGQNEEPWMPRQADPEYRALAKLAPSRWLSLVVTMLVQALYVEDFQSSDGVTSPAWQIWQANGMDSRRSPYIVQRSLTVRATARSPRATWARRCAAIRCARW
jgi:hypothetical protein